MNFKLNLMLIPFTVPRTAFNYLPSCDTIILDFPFRLAKSRLRRLLAGRPLRWVSPFSIIIEVHSKKESDKSGSFFCIARGNQQHFRWKDLQSVH